MPSSEASASPPSMPSEPSNLANRRIRTRMYGGVGGVEPRGSPLSRLVDLHGLNRHSTIHPDQMIICRDRVEPTRRGDLRRATLCKAFSLTYLKQVSASAAHECHFDLNTQPGAAEVIQQPKHQRFRTSARSTRGTEGKGDSDGITGSRPRADESPHRALFIGKSIHPGSPSNSSRHSFAGLH
jgi:hypothetical protein